MPENNQYNYNGPNRNRQRRPRQNPQGYQDYENYEERDSGNAAAISATVKGIIAILLTFLIVAVVIMVFAKNLFQNDDTAPKKTGSVTSTEYIPPETKTATSKVTTKKTTKKKSEDEEEEDEEEASQTITCTSAVYLHPQPSSSSENLLTIPYGAEVKYFRNENGWFYVEYNGTQGYAWNTFFTQPTVTSTAQ